MNAVGPGPISTPAIDVLAGGEKQATEFKANMASQVPLGRVGEPDEIAKAVVFFASDVGSYDNGVELFVDGGMAQL